MARRRAYIRVPWSNWPQMPLAVGLRVFDKQEPSEKRFAKREAEAAGSGYDDIIIEVIPSTSHRRNTWSFLFRYTQLLAIKTQNIVRSAADAVLETLKNDTLKDFDKKKEVEQVIQVGIIINEHWYQIVSVVILPKKIID